MAEFRRWRGTSTACGATAGDGARSACRKEPGLAGESKADLDLVLAPSSCVR